MRNLVQKQITDKNGVITKRWVKPDSGSTSGTSRLPSPQKSSAATRSKTLDRAVKLYIREISDDTGDDLEEEIAHAEFSFDRYSTATLTEIASSSAPNSFVKMYALKCLSDDGADETAVRDLMNSLDVLEEYGVDSAAEAAALALGLGQYSGIEPLDVEGEYPPRRQSQCAALMRVTLMTSTHVYDGNLPESAIANVQTSPNRTSQILTNEKLSALVIERPEELNRILDYMEERQSDDVDHMLEIFDSEVPALSEGIL